MSLNAVDRRRGELSFEAFVSLLSLESERAALSSAGDDSKRAIAVAIRAIAQQIDDGTYQALPGDTDFLRLGAAWIESDPRSRRRR